MHELIIYYYLLCSTASFHVCVQGDVELMRAWVEDLKAVGYRFPVLRNSAQKARKNMQPATPLQVEGRPVEEPFVSPHTPLQWRRHDRYSSHSASYCRIKALPPYDFYGLKVTENVDLLHIC